MAVKHGLHEALTSIKGSGDDLFPHCVTELFDCVTGNTQNWSLATPRIPDQGTVSLTFP